MDCSTKTVHASATPKRSAFASIEPWLPVVSMLPITTFRYIGRNKLVLLAPAVLCAMGLSNTQCGLIISAFSITICSQTGARGGLCGAGVAVTWTLLGTSSLLFLAICFRAAGQGLDCPTPVMPRWAAGRPREIHHGSSGGLQVWRAERGSATLAAGVRLRGEAV